jgi:hypothetical protein
MLRAANSFPSRRVIDCLEELLVTTGRVSLVNGTRGVACGSPWACAITWKPEMARSTQRRKSLERFIPEKGSEAQYG